MQTCVFDVLSNAVHWELIDLISHQRAGTDYNWVLKNVQVVMYV